MPIVDGKHFNYSRKGISMAKNAAKKKGVKVQYKRHGGAAKKKSGYNPLGNCGLFGRQ